MAEYDYRGKDTLAFQRLPGYKKIAAWQAASDLAAQVNSMVKQFGPGYYRLADQMRAAAISISGNIAEGYCSGSLANYIRYAEIARGSAGELGSYIQDCERWELIRDDDLRSLIKQYSMATYYLERLIQALKRKAHDGTWDRSYGTKEPTGDYLAEPPSSESLAANTDESDAEITGISEIWPDLGQASRPE
jgi:four helix bundle protein